MDKRLPLAMLLSLAVWFLYLKTLPPPAETDGPAQDPSTAIVAPADPGQAAGVAAESKAVSEALASNEARHVAAEREVRTMILRAPGEAVNAHDPRGLWQATFDNKGGVLRELRTGHYVSSVEEEDHEDPANWPVLVSGVGTKEEGFAGETGSLLLAAGVSSQDLVERPLAEELWEMELLGTEEAPLGVVFRLAPGRGVSFEKRFEVAMDSTSGWEFKLTLTVSNTGEGGQVKSGPYQFRFTPAACVPPSLGERFYVEPRAVAAGPVNSDDLDQDTAQMKEKGDRLGALDVQAPLAFVGTHNKYFAFLLRGADEASQNTLVGASFRRIFADEDLGEKGERPTKWILGDAQLELMVPPVGESRSWNYRVYAGPKEQHLLTADDPDFLLVTEKDLNWFAGIGKLLLLVLSGLEKLTGNFGWAIILMTLCIRGLLFPLNRRSQTAMARYQKKMKRVQPKIDAIKKKYADDRAEQNKQQQKLMQEEGVFPPLGGCLPMFVQMPIFFGLFSALRTSFDLRQAPFMGYIQDLSRPDALFPFTFDVPFFHWPTFNLLPIIMVVMWVAQQATMPKPQDAQSARMQRMMMFMPVMMGFFLYNYAAGLSLYMITQSTMGIIEQKVIKKVWPIKDDEVETTKKKKGCGPFAGAMEKMAEKQKAQMKLVEQQRAMQAKQRGQAKKKRK